MSESVHYVSQGPNRARFQAYANLLWLRHGGQAEKPEDSTQFLVDDEQSDEDTGEDDDSIVPAKLFDGNEDRMKRAFLDRLAELVANVKDKRHISGTLMIEWPDRVDVLVAKNMGIDKSSPLFLFLQNLEATIRQLSMSVDSSRGRENTVKELWKAILRIYEPRLQYYRNCLEKLLRQCCLSNDSKVDGDDPPLAKELRHFSTILEDDNEIRTNLERHELAIRTAIHILESYDEIEFLNALGNLDKRQQLRRHLGFLARVRRCFDTITMASDALSNFKDMRIVPLEAPIAASSGPPQDLDHWSTEKVISSLCLCFNDETVKSIMGPQWTKAKLEAKFSELKTPISQVHVETQLILAATKQNCTGGRVFGYIGCSKRSCFLCGKFVKAYGGLTTRGYHGKMYNLWTMPEVPKIPRKEALKIATSLQRVEDDMRSLLCTPSTGPLELARESTIGDTLVSTLVRKFSSLHMAKLVHHHLHNDRKASSYADNSHNEVHDGGLMSKDIIEPPEAGNRPTSPGPAIFGHSTTDEEECEVCGRFTRRWCSLCGLGRFCSQECQDDMSSRHLAKCCGRKMTTADQLMDCVFEDLIPQHEFVDLRGDFGFNRCRTQHEESFLLGLYQGLIKTEDFRVTARKLYAWRREGKLTAKIHERFTQRPVGQRGSYYVWFQRNQHVLDPSYSPTRHEDAMHRAIEAARPHMSPEDCGFQDPRELQPPDKYVCFIFYARALQAYYPHPADGLDIWYDFGFCTCRDDFEDGLLAGMYSKLVGGGKIREEYDEELGLPLERRGPELPTCSFGEFWHAWLHGNLVGLMEKHGIIDEKKHPVIESLLTSLPEFLSYRKDDESRPSIWRLNHYLRLISLTDTTIAMDNFQGMKEALVEYGFDAEMDPRTKILLTEFYHHLLGRCSLLQVWRARENGKLLELAESLGNQSRHFNIEDEVRLVLRRLGTCISSS